MLSDTPRPLARPVVRVGGRSLHTLLAPIPFACFLGTLVTDIVYAATADMQWANFSAWMLVVGLIVSVLVVIAGLIDLVGDRRRRTSGLAWIHGLGDAAALALAVLNVFVHSRDAYTSVVPEGLLLSLLTVLILVAVGWFDRDLEGNP
jgi:uncharacterized membrane protein